MIVSIKVKRIGNHLYPDIEHFSGDQIQLDEKVEKVLSKFLHPDECEIVFYEQYDIVADFGVIQFDEQDIVRYLTTDDDFNMTFWIDNHRFIMSSDLYNLLEQQYNMNFHKTLYRIEIW